MEDVIKIATGVFGAWAFGLAVLIWWLRERGSQITSLLADLKAERERNQALQQQVLQATITRAESGTQVGVAIAASNDKFADRVGGLETEVKLFTARLDGICKAKP